MAAREGVGHSCFTGCLSLMCRVVLTGFDWCKPCTTVCVFLVGNAFKASVITLQYWVQSGISYEVSGAGASGCRGVCLWGIVGSNRRVLLLMLTGGCWGCKVYGGVCRVNTLPACLC